MPIVIAQYTTVDTNVVAVKDNKVSFILSDSNICMILSVNKNNTTQLNKLHSIIVSIVEV